MVVGAFFSEVGTALLCSLSKADSRLNELRQGAVRARAFGFLATIQWFVGFTNQHEVKAPCVEFAG